MEELEVKKTRPQKLGKIKKFSVENGKIEVGTINAIECKAFYIELTSWITPQVSVEASTDAIRRRFIKKVIPMSNIYFEGVKATLIDYKFSQTKQNDISGRKSFISIEITLMAKRKFEFDKDLIYAGQMYGENCFEVLNTLSSHFTLSKTK